MGLFDRFRKGSGGDKHAPVSHQEPDTEGFDSEANPDSFGAKSGVKNNSRVDSDFYVEDDYSPFQENDELQEQFLEFHKEDRSFEAIKDGRVQDVLGFYDIPESYFLSPDVLLPEDFENISFAEEIPSGFDRSEVNAFVKKAALTSSEMYEKILERDKHVARLASRIDLLEFEAHNRKVEAEISEGISVLPTEESEELSLENSQLKLKIQRLEEQLSSENGSGSSVSDVGDMELLKDQVSLSLRRIEVLEEQNRELKDRLAVYEDEDSFLNTQERKTENSRSETLVVFGNDELPDFFDEEEDGEEMPGFGNFDFEGPSSISIQRTGSSAFGEEEESLQEFLAKSDYMQEDSDEDDILDAIMSSPEDERE